MSIEAGTSSLTEHLHSLLEATRSASPQVSAEAALALNAARWHSLQSGRSLPHLLESGDAEAFALPENIASAQHVYLDLMSEREVRGYLPALARKSTASLENGMLSSSSISDVAVRAALARTGSGSSPVTCLDLAVGAGLTLLPTAHSIAALGHSPHVLAEDIDVETAIFAAATMFLAGLEPDVCIGNSLVEDPFLNFPIDIAVSQPPVGLNWRGIEAQIKAKRGADWYRWGLPPISDSSWLFASRMIEKLRPSENGGGRAVTFMAPGSLQGYRSDDHIRRAMLHDDLVETIIGLPGRLNPYTEVPLYAVVFTNRKDEDRQGRIQVINLRPYFESSSESPGTPRVLTAEALDVLQRALETERAGIASRTLPVEYFVRRRAHIRQGRRQQPGAEATGCAPLDWDIEVPATDSPDHYISARYGPLAVSWQLEEIVHCPLEIDSLFDAPPVLRAVSGWASSQHWPVTRLSTLTAAAPEIRDDAHESSAGNVLFLPTSVGADASVRLGSERESPVAHRVLRLNLLAELVSADFLAGWLNSVLGRECRRLAYTMSSSGSTIQAVRTDPKSLARYLDELVVPIPPTNSQLSIANAEGRLAAASRIVDSSRRDLWSDPKSVGQVIRRFDSLVDDSLIAWANDLPYPIASALWTLESKRLNTDAAHKQMFLAWEAFAAFMAVMLLSAVSQDHAMRNIEAPKLREALSWSSLTMRRATLGSWCIVVQHLSKAFRSLLMSNDFDERARILQIFGSPSFDSLSRLLDVAVIQILSDVNAKRNLWDGHTGAATESELHAHLAYLRTRLEELRDVIGTAWRELQCVRADDGYRRHGRVFQRVEIAMGPNTQFLQKEIEVGSLMEKGDIYLATEGAAEPLPLQHLMLIRPSADGARNACYFYSRLDGSDVRLVSYHSAEVSDVTEAADDVVAAIQDLIEPSSGDSPAEA